MNKKKDNEFLNVNFVYWDKCMESSITLSLCLKKDSILKNFAKKISIYLWETRTQKCWKK